MTITNVFREGKVHVQKRQCSTCIFGRNTSVDSERVEEMVSEANRVDGCIPCHHTLNGEEQAICRGYYDRGSSQPLTIADRLGYIEFVQIDDFVSGVQE